MSDSLPLQGCDTKCVRKISVYTCTNPAGPKQSKKHKKGKSSALNYSCFHCLSALMTRVQLQRASPQPQSPLRPHAWPVLIMLYLMVCSLCQPCECWAVLITRSTWWSAGTDAHQTQAGWFTTPLWYADARCWDTESLAIKMLNGSLKMILIGWEWESGCGQVSQWGLWFKKKLLFKLKYIKCKVKWGADSSEISSVNCHIT